MRVRWDRVAVLLTTVALLVLAIIRLESGPGRPATAAARPSIPPAAHCPAGHGGQVVRSAPGAGRTVALTFDDGPGQWTPAVLAVLRQRRVRASFFMIGRNAAADPELVSTVVTEGHLVGNHTWSHRPPNHAGAWNGAALDSELERTDHALRAIPGAAGCWFRPPAGVLAGSEAVTARRGLSVALWSVDTRDWAMQGEASAASDPDLPDQIVARATAVADQRHPVVLLHDGGGYRGATVKALPAIIDFYRSRGFTFVRLDGR